MEHKLILAVSGFPSLYDTNAPTYRDLNMRADSWRHVSEIIAVPESECRRKWKTLRDQHRRERQREKDRRESGVGLFNYRPWRYSSILSFLNPFIDARAAGCNGWALDPQPSHLQAHEMGCSTTTDTRSDEDGEDGGGYDVDATTTSSDFLHRKRPSSGGRDAGAFKEAKMEAACEGGARDDRAAPPDNMKELFEAMMQSVTSLAASLASSHSSSLASDQPPPPGRPAPQHNFRRLAAPRGPPPPPRAASRLSHLKTEQREAEGAELLDDRTDGEEEEGEEEEGGAAAASTRPTRAKRKSSETLLVEHLRRLEAREAQREQRDEATLFLLSLAPAVRRLPAQKQSWVRTRMQQLLHEAEFGAFQ
ncbi:uncharacterized protein LOC130202936 [Pseudoliparis swirei]|uniref:uncharacterized protein LOC130202936 n=1 Tax=Pseudoliparis swirei TaxID=2059687 RepID=UPI0024BED86E|nr:uncharacterized protein LOC130202936 [Pseudoliparis swirei]